MFASLLGNNWGKSRFLFQTKYGQKPSVVAWGGKEQTEYIFGSWHSSMSVNRITGEQCPGILTRHIHWLQDLPSVWCTQCLSGRWQSVILYGRRSEGWMEMDREAMLAQLADSNCRYRMFSQLHVLIIIDGPELDQSATSLKKTKRKKNTLVHF